MSKRPAAQCVFVETHPKQIGAHRLDFRVSGLGFLGGYKV